MGSVFFSLVIYPLTQIIELVFSFCQKLFDNTGFTILIAIYDLVLIALSVLCIGFFPSVAGLLIANTNALRLRLYKYDYLEQHPESVLCPRINWAPYFKYIVECVQNGKAIDTDWCGTLANEAVQLTEVNEKAAAAGTAEKIAEVRALLESGQLHVFDTSFFTVEGKKLDSYTADVDSDDAYTPDTEVIKDGYFHESEYRSAPYFDLQIDGITLLNTAF